MTEDVIEFLVKYEFNLMISLDGDKKSHDINRRFKTGKGSFDIILENLSRLKAYNEEYYSKVLFNCVISSSSDLENIYRFYSEEELFEAGTVNFNYVNPVGLKDETLSRITQKKFQSTSTSIYKDDFICIREAKMGCTKSIVAKRTARY